MFQLTLLTWYKEAPLPGQSLSQVQTNVRYYNNKSVSFIQKRYILKLQFSILLASPISYHIIATSDKAVLISTTELDHCRRKIHFSDIWNFYHLLKDRYSQSCHPKILTPGSLTHGIISRSHDSHLQKHFTKHLYRQMLRVWTSLLSRLTAQWHGTWGTPTCLMRIDLLLKVADTSFSLIIGSAGCHLRFG